jgi:hypothetical protein
MDIYAVGFARPDRWRGTGRADENHPWHAVAARRPIRELDGEIELAICGAIVQVWGAQNWERLATGRTACEDCRRLSGVAAAQPVSASPSGAR